MIKRHWFCGENTVVIILLMDCDQTNTSLQSSENERLIKLFLDIVMSIMRHLIHTQAWCPWKSSLWQPVPLDKNMQLAWIGSRREALLFSRFPSRVAYSRWILVWAVGHGNLCSCPISQPHSVLSPQFNEKVGYIAIYSPSGLTVYVWWSNCFPFLNGDDHEYREVVENGVLVGLRFQGSVTIRWLLTQFVTQFSFCGNRKSTSPILVPLETKLEVKAAAHFIFFESLRKSRG